MLFGKQFTIKNYEPKFHANIERVRRAIRVD
jgi:hypothetical protein